MLQMGENSQELDLNFKVEKEMCSKGKYESPRGDRLFECKNKSLFSTCCRHP